MLLPCEVAVKTVIPSIRALLARTLMEKHGMKELQVAKLLGVSQSAVSKYVTRTRGSVMKIEETPELRSIVSKMTSALISSPGQSAELLLLFCQACRHIRDKGYMCPFCRGFQEIKIDECGFCNNSQR
jgi:predicted transcriptional regulator